MSLIPPFASAPVTPRLITGRQPLTRADVDELAALGITHVLDLRQPREWAGPGRLGSEAIDRVAELGISRRNVPVEDGGAPTLEDLDAAVGFLDGALAEARGRAFVHCRAGRERTGAAVVAWWAWENGTGLGESVDAVQRANPAIVPLHHQREAVRRWLHAPRPNRVPSLRSRLRGCLLGGAAGDALGAAVEFLDLAAIHARFGEGGIRRAAPAYGLPVAITDDTQMTAFTVEGLIRASVGGRSKGTGHPAAVLRRAYWRWLATQGERPDEEPGDANGAGEPAWMDGWLVREPVLRHRRAPGNSCLSALRSGRFGTPAAPINDSKGCGAVMRGAPVGFVGFAAGAELFALGCEIGALTHGHPTGYGAAGALAAIVAALRAGARLETAVAEALGHLAGEPFRETRRAIESALALAGQGEPSPEKVESLGGGWVAEEALAIALYAALAAASFDEALILAANHSGDSDSTAAICGNLLGARHGVFAIPTHHLRDLDAAAVLRALADDFALESTEPPTAAAGGASDAWLERYPGW